MPIGDGSAIMTIYSTTNETKNASSLTVFDVIINLFLSAVYSGIGGIFSVNTLQTVFYVVSSVISSEHAAVAVAVIPTALLGAGAVVSLAPEVLAFSFLVRPTTMAAASFPINRSSGCFSVSHCVSFSAGP
jgi:hypothetical protein